jgi:TRAP transporter TAXI family solute receptor
VRRIAVAALCLFILCCSKGQPGSATFVSIATGGTGGVYYPYGGGLAKVLNETLPGIRATAEVTAASVDNLKLIRDGRADIAFALADTLADAVAGRGPFDGRPVPAASLAVLYSNYTHIVTTTSTGIATVTDLRGKSVSTGAPGSGTEVIALRVLRAAGLDPDRDLTRQGLGASESAGALKDGKVAAFFWSGGLPTAAVQDLAHTPGMTLRAISSPPFAAISVTCISRSRSAQARIAAWMPQSPVSALPTSWSSTNRCRSSWHTTSPACSSKRRPSSRRSTLKPTSCRLPAPAPGLPRSIILER